MKAEGVNENWKLQGQRNREDTVWCSSDSSREQNRLSVLDAKVKTSTCNPTALLLERLF